MSNVEFPGARWLKFDFHSHTPASFDTPWARSPDLGLSPEDWVVAYLKAKIDCVAVTDHNSGEWIDRLKEAAEGLKPEGVLTIFPGVELSVAGGFHILAIFDPCTGRSEIDRLLGAVGVESSAPGAEQVTRRGLLDVLAAVHDAGGLPIPAHADGPKGLFELVDGRPACDAATLKAVASQSRIVAVELLSSSSRMPPVLQDLHVTWTSVLGSDCHSFRGSKQLGTEFTWVKMGESRSLENLRLALFDGAPMSVRRSDDVPALSPGLTPDYWIEELKVEEARYAGRGSPLTLRFSPWMNAVIGGRGSGKSTIVHCARLAFRKEADLSGRNPASPARLAFESFGKVPSSRSDSGGLQQATIVSAVVNVFGKSEQIHWRVPSAQSNPEPSGRVASFPVQILSQGQISELVDSSSLPLLDLVDQTPKIRLLIGEYLATEKQFLSLRAQVRELDARLAEREVVDAELESVSSRLRGLEALDPANCLSEHKRRASQRDELDDVLRIVETTQSALRNSWGANPGRIARPDSAFDPGAAEDLGIMHVIQDLESTIEDGLQALAAGASELASRLDTFKNSIADSSWSAAVRVVEAKYRAVLAALREQGLQTVEAFDRLLEDRARLVRARQQFRALETEREHLIAEIEECLCRLRTQRRDVTQARKETFQSADVDSTQIRILLAQYPRTPSALENHIRVLLGLSGDRFGDDVLKLDRQGQPVAGLVFDLLDALPEEASAAAEEMERRFERLSVNLLRTHGASGRFLSFLEREAARVPEIVDRLQIPPLEDEVNVEYSPRGDGCDFRPINQASPGQRSAALLSFLLGHSEGPVILDQPEDDLDNRLIYQLLVQQMRRTKVRRQLVVVTHNPNIVVNGDAEMVHAMDVGRGQSFLKAHGSLQNLEVREEVCRVMEGGRDALNSRYRRLGLRLE